MADHNNAKDAVTAWLNESEGFSLRIERLHEDAASGNDLVPWLVEAFRLGADRAAPEGQVQADRHQIARVIWDVMAWAAAQGAPEGSIPKYMEWGNSFGEVEARRAADRILALTPPPAAPTDNTALVEALRPFASMVDKNTCKVTVTWEDGDYKSTYTNVLKPSDFYAAREAYSAALASREAPPAAPTGSTGLVERHANKQRNVIINRCSTDLETIINGHDPEIGNLNNDVWDRLDKMAVEIEAHLASREAPRAAQEPSGRVKVPANQTPLDDKLSHRLLDVLSEGSKARDDGTGSPYHGHSLEHSLHAAGWVMRDLRLALDAAKATPPPACQQEAVTEALSDLLQAVCGETGFAACVRRESGKAYPWPALDLAEAKALRAMKGSE